MDVITLNFEANEQELTSSSCPYRFASNTVSYIEAVFELGENWTGYDTVRAVWHNDFATISTLLDENNTCVVPPEVLTRTGKVIVNLVGSIVSGDTVTDRLTTYPLLALVVDAKARVSSDETAEVTASQFEQFVEQVSGYVTSASGYADDASGYADDAKGYAEDAQEALNTLLTRPLYPSDGQ